MRITEVRNATLRLDLGGVRFLVDPMLAEQGAYPGFEGTANSHRRNPLVPLPLPMGEILDVDAVIVATHHETHAGYGAAAIVAGKHVLVQKPLSTELAHADRFVIALAGRKIVGCGTGDSARRSRKSGRWPAANSPAFRLTARSR